MLTQIKSPTLVATKPDRPPPTVQENAGCGAGVQGKTKSSTEIIHPHTPSRQCSQCRIPCDDLLCDQCAGLIEAAQFIRRAIEVLRRVR